MKITNLMELFRREETTPPLFNQISRRDDLLFVLVNIVSFVALSLIVFDRHESVLFLRYDGTYHLTLAANQLDWMGRIPSLTMDYLKANGEIAVPLLSRLTPAYVLGSWLAGGGIDPALSYTIFAFELFASTIFLGLCIGLRARTAVIAGWLVCLFTLPYFVPTLTYIRLWGNPAFLTGIACMSISIGLFYRLGQGGRLPRDIVIAAVITLLQAYTIVTQTIVFTMTSPIFLLFAGIFLITARDRAELLRKLIIGGGCAALLAAVFLEYLYGLYITRKTVWFWQEMYPVPIDWRDATFFTHIHETAGLAGRVIYFGAPVLALALIWKGREGARRTALAFLVFLATMLAVVVSVSLWVGDWRGPVFAYIDMAAVPFYALIFAAILDPSGRWVTNLLASRRIGFAVLAAIPLAPWLALYVSIQNASKLNDHNPWPWPPAKTAVTETVGKAIGLHDGAPFRGRIVNLSGSKGQFEYLFLNQHVYDIGMLHAIGNEHRQYGFWYFDIPTLSSGHHFSSPFFHLVSSRFLTKPGTVSMRTHVAMDTYNPRILQSLGTRFVINDQPIAGAGTPRLKVSVPDGRIIYLYELADPNVGNYSPTRTRLARDARTAIDIMASPGMDFRREVVVHTPLPPDLVPASRAEVRIRRGGLWIGAESGAKSVIVLPFEYSHCLSIELEVSISGEAHLFRANLNQTGLLFSGRIEGTVINRLGPFHNRGCRMADNGDARRLDLDATRNWWPSAGGRG